MKVDKSILKLLIILVTWYSEVKIVDPIKCRIPMKTKEKTAQDRFLNLRDYVIRQLLGSSFLTPIRQKSVVYINSKCALSL